jgi:photosystem II stability/assembly factor-like uncharacterized protein
MHCRCIFSCCLSLISVLPSTGFAQSWTKLSLSLKAAVSSAIQLPSGVILAGTFSDALYRSSNDGATWEKKSVGNGTEDIWALSVTQNGTILAATGSHGVYRSSNEGVSFTNSNSGLNGTSFAFGIIPQTKYLVVGNFGVYRSSNDGKSWSPTNNGPIGGLPHMGADAFAFDSTGIMYCGTDGGLSVSSNSGATWTPLLVTDIDTVVTVVSLSNDYRLYVATDHAGVLMSADTGKTWRDYSAGLPDRSIRSMVIANNSLYVGTESNGVYQSSLGSPTWTPLSMGAAHNRVYSLTLLHSGAVLAASDSGLFQLSFGVSRVIQSDPSERALLACSSIENGKAIIRYSLPHAAQIRIEFLDILGRSLKSIQCNTSEGVELVPPIKAAVFCRIVSPLGNKVLKIIQ